MNPSEYIDKAGSLRTREIAVKNEISELNFSISTTEGIIESLESELSMLYSELSYAYSSTDEDGNYDYSAVAYIESRISSVRSQMGTYQAELSRLNSALYRAEAELDDVESEKEDVLSDINESAEAKNEDILRAAGITGRYSPIGQNLQSQYMQSLMLLQEAAEILGGRISVAAGGVSSGGGRSHSRGSSGGGNSAHVGGVGVREENNTHTTASAAGTLKLKRMQPLNSGKAGTSSGRSGGNFKSVPQMVKAVPAPQKSTSSAGAGNNIPAPVKNTAVNQTLKKITPQSRKQPVALMTVNKKAAARLKNSGFRNIAPKDKYRSEQVKCLKSGLRYKKIDGHRHYIDDNDRVYRVDNMLVGNNEYTVKGYTYRTDDSGCIISAAGTLRTSKENKSAISDSIQSIGRGDERADDDRGHIIGRQFDAINAIGNLIPQNWKINQQKYRDFENSLAKRVNNGDEVTVDIRLIYPENSSRPEKLVVNYTVNGIHMSREFPNR